MKKLTDAQKKLTDAQKIKAITILLKHGSRSSEWAEAGLLNAIEKIVNDEVDGSADSLEKLMKEARRY